ncbi:YwhD family protein [Risungbinella massiliensis]|uniref:YwhD family protein n=1 Tax=Risungbinella massiliensis TaxID=1329796 RepID=UPI0005CBCB2C|nr:YwhD family protein [Risungbinella massiliensis]
MSDQKKPQFQIISGKSTTHKAYHTGTLNLSNLSSVLLSAEEAKIDLGLIHAKSRVERGIKFTADQTEVPNGEEYWVIWVAVDRQENGPYYAGLAACSMKIDKESKKGWKNLAFHVNRMDDALKRRIKVTELPDHSKEVLAKFLQEHNPEMWENSTIELKESLLSKK